MESDKLKASGLKKAALEYHERGRRGKIEVISSKPCVSQLDLSLAYTPGVAQPCLEIERDPSLARLYTAKGNLVAVISNGTAVLGLGDIGPLAGKPVMEGKGVLFKRFADIDVFDIEVDSKDPEDIIRTVKNIAPTFGGINLEDIKAPECFIIEERLKAELDIPVFHDDQHGTAIISGAALLNALEVTKKNIKQIKVVFSGAGAAGIACANFWVNLGVNPDNILMTDSKGVLWKGRGDEGRNIYKDKYYRDTDRRDLADAMRGADVFCGLSQKGILTKDMVRTMGEQPIIFAMANPDPEITYEDAKEARPDVLMATGRSDYPNQVNNVLGFPFIFRGALDVEATAINEEMKMAAAMALANLAKEEVPDSVKRAYDDMNLAFGPEYIIPKPFDQRVLVWSASAVAEAAMKTGVARKMIDIEEYKEQLREKSDWTREIMRKIFIRARRDLKRIVFPEGTDPKIIWAASEIVRERVAKPILLGKSKQEILDLFEELHHEPEGIEIIEPKSSFRRQIYVNEYYRMHQRNGISQDRAALDMRNYINFGAMMVHMGDADGMVAGVSQSFHEVLQPALRIIGPRKKGGLVAGMYMLLQDHKLYCLADCSVNINPTSEELASIVKLAAGELKSLQIDPKIAMLSFSNFGTVLSPESEKVAKAVEIIKETRPDLIIDGPVQGDFALDTEFMKKRFPFSDLAAQAPNLLIFPSLDAGNISLRLLRKLGKAHTIGPIMIGMAKPIQILPVGVDISQIINLTALAAVDAQELARREKGEPLMESLLV
ncbi:MAG: NADP-dependent malic enzyme [Lewinellaceae bacterium]|nr:NADP-dependent malic enzyme [Lewinellaceae bacterium]